jgi:hypothetical protein
MGQTVIEGTWEEVAQHAAELAGKRVRVTVLDESAATLDRALAGLIEAAERLHGERSSTAPAGPDWGEAVAEKFRGQGFHL